MSGLTTAKELRSEVKSLAEEMREIIQNPEGENDTLSADQEQKFDRLHERQEELIAQHEEIEEQEEARRQREDQIQGAEQWLKQSRGVQAGQQDTRDIDEGGEDRADGPGEEEYADAFDTYLRYGKEALDHEQRNLLRSSFMRTERGSVHAPEGRAHVINQDTKGGFLVPSDMLQQITAGLKDFGGIRNTRAEIITTSDGRAIPFPTNDDTGNKGRLVSEAASRNNATDLTFGVTSLKAYNYTSDFIKVSPELVQDAAVDIIAYISQRASERVGRATNEHFVSGDGASEPYGVVTQATSGVSAASSTVVDADELLELKHGVDPAYRRRGAQWLFNDDTLLKIKKLKDGDGRPLWQSGIALGEPNTIDGDPYVIDQDMPSVASGNKAILYGDFSNYKIRDVTGMSLRRVDERFIDDGLIAFILFSRHDGALVDAGQNPVQAITF